MKKNLKWVKYAAIAYIIVQVIKSIPILVQVGQAALQYGL